MSEQDESPTKRTLPSLRATLEVKNLWPGMVLDWPDLEGVKAPIPVQVLRVEISEVREGLDILRSGVGVKLTVQTAQGETLKNTFVPEWQMALHFGPSL